MITTLLGRKGLLTGFALLFLLPACEKSSGPNFDDSINAFLADPGVTEMWLEISISSLGTRQAQLLRGDSLIAQFPANGDTVIYDAGLQPAEHYIYQLRTKDDGNTGAEQEISATTLDTTSRDFIWTIDTIGAYSTLLNDVAIINENDIWAVGEIHTLETDQFDSLGNWMPPYNAAHWNGVEWELERIRTNACGGVDYPPIQTIFTLSDNEILFGHLDASITQFDGTLFVNNCSFIQQINGSIKEIWGNSVTDFYVVGQNGLIAHYDGTSWSKLESGTDLPIQDIWGAKNRESEELLLLAIASRKYELSEPQLLKIDNQTVTDLFLPIQSRQHGLWFQSPRTTYLCGSGVHVQKDGKWEWLVNTGIPGVFLNRIRGEALNNLWVVGDFGVAAHFNGLNWKNYPEFLLSNGNWESLAVKDGLAVMVGWNGGKGHIVTIRH